MADQIATGQNWIDPWLRLREKTAQYNDIKCVAERYSKMKRLAIEQYNDLKERPKVKQETLSGLLEIITFCANKADPLWDSAQKLETELHEETERMMNDD